MTAGPLVSIITTQFHGAIFRELLASYRFGEASTRDVVRAGTRFSGDLGLHFAGPTQRCLTNKQTWFVARQMGWSNALVGARPASQPKRFPALTT